MDDFTRKILADVEDRIYHPEDWSISLVCRECQGRNTSPVPKAEVLQSRERNGLGPGTPIMLSVICAECAGPEEE